MDKLIPTFTDVSSWAKRSYIATGGTRSKNIAVDEDGQDWFIKGSKVLDNGTIRYPLEFWSEIVASKLGQYFGFEVLDYNIAYDHSNDKQPVQCISKSMIMHEQSTLSEGIQYLMGHLPNFNPNEEEDQYSVDFIEKSLTSFKLEDQFPKFIETILFDALIGNSDRHSENWGFISDYKPTIDQIERDLAQSRGWLKTTFLKFLKYGVEILPKRHEAALKERFSSRKSVLRSQSVLGSPTYSPIYDSGCCLGRELLDDRIEKMLRNDQMLSAYVKRGKSTVRWRYGKPPKHFDLVRQIVLSYKEESIGVLKRIEEKADPNQIRLIINQADSNLPEELRSFALPPFRKELMVSLTLKRLEILQNYL